MAYVLKDSYNTVDNGTGFGGTYKLAQTFTPETSYTATGISLYLKVFSAPGSISGGIYNTTAGEPSGAALATFSFTLSETAEWKTIAALSTGVALTADTLYGIVLDGPGDEIVYWYGDGEVGTDDYTGGEPFTDIGAGWVKLHSPNNWTDLSFRIYSELAVPEKPTNPTPIDTADDVTLDQATISWEDGGGADTYNIYYGENEEGLTLVSEGQAETSFTISGIDYGSPFDYVISRTWRIDAVNDAGTTTGDVWTFTTIVFDPPLPTGVTLDAEGNPTGTPTGENNMYTVKRLIAAANNAIWYGGV